MTVPPNTINLDGQIERIAFHNPETYFLIAKFRVNGQSALVTVLGHVPEPRPGETLRLSGSWQEHPRFGQQFKIEGAEVLLPAGVEEIRRYLASGMIKGIGPRLADRLISRFGSQTLAIIEDHPERLVEVRGIGPRTARSLHQAWQEHHAVRSLMAFLQACGVKATHGARIYKTYGSEALQILKTDPYQVALDLPRVGFNIADAVVRHLDLPIQEEERAEACLRHLLETALEDGHLFIPLADLQARCSTAFMLDYHAVGTALESLVLEQQINIDDQAPEAKASDGLDWAYLRRAAG